MRADRRDERQLVEVVHAREGIRNLPEQGSRFLERNRHLDSLHRSRVRAEEQVRPVRRVGVAERCDGPLLEPDEALRSFVAVSAIQSASAS